MPPKKALSRNAEKRAAKAAAAQDAAKNLFVGHYQQIFGAQRIPELIDSLEDDTIPGALINAKYAESSFVKQYIDANAGSERQLGLGSLLFYVRRDGHLFSPSIVDSFGKGVAYHMDAASLLAVVALDPSPDSRVLDMCAAPGGKSLAILQSLGGKGSLTCNDVSQDRRRRLQDVIHRYTPMPGGAISVPTVEVVGQDGTLPGSFGTAAYDCVLLDAPCSSERHVLHDTEELQKWGPGRIKANAVRQQALLLNALEACVEGGTIVYSTCALSPVENDDVVHACLKKYNGAVSPETPVAIVPLRFAFGESTKAGGWHVLPDSGLGFGPLYICKLIKHPQVLADRVKGATAAVPRQLRGDYSEGLKLALNPPVTAAGGSGPGSAAAGTASGV